MKPFRRKGTELVGRLEAAEVGILGLLVDQLEQLLTAEGTAGDPVVERLFPAGHASDAQVAADYRDLTESALREGKADDIALLRATLPVDGGEVRLDDDQARAWLRTTNDLRLALGTRLGVSADRELSEDPADQQVAVYHWLTAVQGSLVDAIAAAGRRRW